MGKSSGSNQLIYLGAAVVVVALALAYYMNGKFNQHARAIEQLDQVVASLADKTNNSIGIIGNNLDAIKEEMNTRISNLENQILQLRHARRGGGEQMQRRPTYDDDDYLSSRVD